MIEIGMKIFIIHLGSYQIRDFVNNSYQMSLKSDLAKLDFIVSTQNGLVKFEIKHHNTS